MFCMKVGSSWGVLVKQNKETDVRETDRADGGIWRAGISNM